MEIPTLLLSQNFMLKRIIMVNTKINLFFTEKTDDGTNNKEQHLHENKALVTSTSMEDSNELQTPKKGGDQTPAGYHTPFKDRYHVPLDFEEGLLCTSTPKQPLRQLLMTIKSIDDV